MTDEANKKPPEVKNESFSFYWTSDLIFFYMNVNENHSFCHEGIQNYQNLLGWMFWESKKNLVINQIYVYNLVSHVSAYVHICPRMSIHGKSLLSMQAVDSYMLSLAEKTVNYQLTKLLSKYICSVRINC